MRFALLLVICSAALHCEGQDFSKEALKRAAARVLSNDCGTSYQDPDFREDYKRLINSGPEALSVLVELVLDGKMCPFFVANAAGFATRWPFSEPLRRAVRQRMLEPQFIAAKDPDPGTVLGICIYFAKFGEETDLAWAEEAISRLENVGARDLCHKQLEPLRARLKKP